MRVKITISIWIKVGIETGFGSEFKAQDVAYMHESELMSRIEIRIKRKIKTWIESGIKTRARMIEARPRRQAKCGSKLKSRSMSTFGWKLGSRLAQDFGFMAHGRSLHSEQGSCFFGSKFERVPA